MKTIFYFFLAAAILTGCQPNYYMPHTQNVTLFDSVNQAQVNVNINSGGIELNAAYSVGNNTAIAISGGVYRPSNVENGDGGSGYYMEPSFGYFKPLENNLVFETYLLAGFGNVENHFPSTIGNNPGTTGKISANIMTYGLQPQIGYKTKYIMVALSSRFVAVNYSDISGSLVFENQNQVGYLNRNANNFMIEPALTFRGGLEHLKFQVQFGNSFNVTNSDFKQGKDYFSVGIVGQF